MKLKNQNTTAHQTRHETFLKKLKLKQINK